MRPSIFICSSQLVDIFVDSSIMFLDLISHRIIELIAINIYCILYVYLNFSTNLLSPLKHICCFSAHHKAFRITLILFTQIFLRQNLPFSGKYGDFFFSKKESQCQHQVQETGQILDPLLF